MLILNVSPLLFHLPTSCPVTSFVEVLLHLVTGKDPAACLKLQNIKQLMMYGWRQMDVKDQSSSEEDTGGHTLCLISLV